MRFEVKQSIDSYGVDKANMKDPNEPKTLPKDPLTIKPTTKPTPKLRRTGTANITPALSAEFIIESDNDNDTESRQSSAIGSGAANRPKLMSPTSPLLRPRFPPLVTKAKACGKKRPPSPDMSGDIFGSSESEGSRKRLSESESGADTEGSGGREAEKPITQSIPSQTIQEPVPTYKPPNGFGRAKITLPNSSTLSTLFSASRSNNTQLWHITVPATIPIDAIQKTSLTNLLTTETLSSYKGSDYGFVQDRQSGQDKKYILIPNARESQYESIPADICRTLHLRQLVKLPNHTTTSRRPGDGPQDHLVLPRVYKKFIRQQPEGLRMRYRPFGDTEPDLGGFLFDCSTPDDVEATNAQFRLPPGVEKTQLAGKRRSADTGSDEDKHSAKKRRRKNKPKSNGYGYGNVKELKNGVDPSGIAQVEDPQKPTAHENLAKEISVNVNGTADDARDGGTKRHSKRTSDERTSRKEEKRRRKEQEKARDKKFESNVVTPQKKEKDTKNESWRSHSKHV